MGKKARQRVERQGAYDWVNKEVSKWQEVVSQEAQSRTLDLTEPAYVTTTIDQFINNDHLSDLQKKVNNIVQHPEDDEEIEETGLSDRVGTRSRLMYLHQKQKRQAKIKSKLYHKRKKRQREKAPEEEEDD